MMRCPKYNTVVPEALRGLLLPPSFTKALVSSATRAETPGTTRRRIASSAWRLDRRQRFLPLPDVPSGPSFLPGRSVSILRLPTCSLQGKHGGVASFSSSTKSETRNSDDYSHHIRSYNSHYIDGKWTDPSENGTIDVVDPNHGRVVATVPRGTRDEALAAIGAARRSKRGWSHGTSPRERLDHIRLFLERFRSPGRVDEIVDRLAVELGCTRAFARNVQAMAPIYHTQTLLDLLDGGAFAWEEAAGRCTVAREAVGVVGAITPWNYPLNQITLKVIPALVAGCTVVLKPSEVTPLVAYSFAEALEEAGLPDGVFNMVVGRGPECGQVLAEHPGVDLVSFTGSTAAGKVLAGAASETMKTLRTELGGKSAALLLDDADLERVVPAFVKQLTSNTGQSCNALSRMIVPREHQETVLAIAARTMREEVVGDSSNEGTTLGPLVSEAQHDRVVSYIRRGIAEGATLVAGGPEPPDGLGEGYFVSPTLFGDVTGGMSIAQEEIFGPVLCVLPYDTEEEAIDTANGTPYGLNSAVASRDTKRALGVAGRLESGMVGADPFCCAAMVPFNEFSRINSNTS